MSEYMQVSTTVEKKEDAQRIGREAVKSRLAACVQIVGPISSIYWWKGQIEETEEWLCLMKTKKDLFEPLAQKLRALHPYEVPEIVAVPLIAGNPDYFRWVDQETRSVI
ncbi:MAG: divalent-cation tolerance protein CutA [Thermodesulfobacteriota bacterium]